MNIWRRERDELFFEKFKYLQTLLRASLTLRTIEGSNPSLCAVINSLVYIYDT